MAARRYQRGWAAASLRVMFASSLLMKRSRPEIPGKDKLSSLGKDSPSTEDLEATGFRTCPIDGGEIVRGKNGRRYCQICSRRVEDMPDALGS
jgi:hypothetical protein